MPLFAVYVTPRAVRDEVLGTREGQGFSREVCVRVTAPPDGGLANKAVCRLLAKELGLPKTAVQVRRGESARHKMVEAACSESALSAWQESLPSL